MRLLIFFGFFFFVLSSKGQYNSGFKKGDAELVKFMEQKLLSQVFSDTSSSSFFTVAILFFDSCGNLDTIRFINDNDHMVKKYIAKLFMGTQDLWDSGLTKNQVLFIPIELLKMDINDKVAPSKYTQNFSMETLKLFRLTGSSFKATVLEPIVMLSYSDIKYRK
jgi:hypothetical protein